MLPNVEWLAYEVPKSLPQKKWSAQVTTCRLHKVRTIIQVTTKCTDQTWQIIHWDPTWQINRNKAKQAHMQGAATMESVYWFHEGEHFIENLWLIYARYKRQFWHGQNITQRRYKMPPHMSNIGSYKACNSCIWIRRVTLR